MNVPDVPERIARLPRHAGLPVPWFVSRVDRERKVVTDDPAHPPEFRFVSQRKLLAAIQRRLCWICGQPLGRNVAFAVGPMCTVNRVSSEPAQHRECSCYAARACPFLTDPSMERRRRPGDEYSDPPGTMFERNPGAVAIWITREWRAASDHKGHRAPLLVMGDPIEVLWFARGRRASRAEVAAAFEAGLPRLRELAVRDGPAQALVIEEAIRLARAYWPLDAAA